MQLQQFKPLSVLCLWGRNVWRKRVRLSFLHDVLRLFNSAAPHVTRCNNVCRRVKHSGAKYLTRMFPSSLRLTVCLQTARRSISISGERNAESETERKSNYVCHMRPEVMERDVMEPHHVGRRGSDRAMTDWLTDSRRLGMLVWIDDIVVVRLWLYDMEWNECCLIDLRQRPNTTVTSSSVRCLCRRHVALIYTVLVRKFLQQLENNGKYRLAYLLQEVLRIMT